MIMTIDPAPLSDADPVRLQQSYLCEYGLPRCSRCGRRHRSYRTLAPCRWPRAGRIDGDGPWAVVSCSGYTVTLWPTLDDAEACVAMLDQTHCGHRCYRGARHRVIDLARLVSGVAA